MDGVTALPDPVADSELIALLFASWNVVTVMTTILGTMIIDTRSLPPTCGPLLELYYAENAACVGQRT